MDGCANRIEESSFGVLCEIDDDPCARSECTQQRNVQRHAGVRTFRISRESIFRRVNRDSAHRWLRSTDLLAVPFNVCKVESAAQFDQADTLAATVGCRKVVRRCHLRRRVRASRHFLIRAGLKVPKALPCLWTIVETQYRSNNPVEIGGNSYQARATAIRGTGQLTMAQIHSDSG